MSKTKILWISDLSETGYTNASRILVNYLLEKQDKYDVNYFAINHFHNYDKILEMCKSLFPKLKQSNFYTIDNENFEMKKINPILFKEDAKVRTIHMEQRFGYYDLEKVLVGLRPEIVISINDNGALERHCKIVDYVNKKYSLKIKKICYLPIDCYNLPESFFDRIKCDEMWALTKFGRDVMLNANFKGSIKIVPHGMDTQSFYKLGDTKDVLRIKWLPERLRNRFIILNTNKNQIRKRLDITLAAFRELHRKFPGKIAMILKTGLTPSINDGGLELIPEIKKLGEDVERDIVVIDKSLSIVELNEIYNLVDVNINSSIGEGWGIIPCEVALCGIPQLVPDNTSYPEIFFKDCLVDAEYKLRIEREGKTVVNPNGLQCICKGYRGYIENENKVSYLPTITPVNMESILLSKNGNDYNPNIQAEIGNGIVITKMYRTWKAVEEMLMEKKPLFFQIFSENGEKLEKLTHYVKSVNYDRLKIYYNIDSFVIDDIGALGVLIKEPKVSSFVEKISELIENPERTKLLGELCRKVIYDNYRPEIVGKILEENLDDFIRREIIVENPNLDYLPVNCKKNIKEESKIDYGVDRLDEIEFRLRVLEEIVIGKKPE